MNKLEELHILAFDSLTPMNMAKTAAEITTDVAVKFGDFCKNLIKNNKEIIRNNPDITTQELFEEFINNHYGK